VKDLGTIKRGFYNSSFLFVKTLVSSIIKFVKGLKAIGICFKHKLDIISRRMR